MKMLKYLYKRAPRGMQLVFGPVDMSILGTCHFNLKEKKERIKGVYTSTIGKVIDAVLKSLPALIFNACKWESTPHY